MHMCLYSHAIPMYGALFHMSTIAGACFALDELNSCDLSIILSNVIILVKWFMCTRLTRSGHVHQISKVPVSTQREKYLDCAFAASNQVKNQN